MEKWLELQAADMYHPETLRRLVGWYWGTCPRIIFIGGKQYVSLWKNFINQPTTVRTTMSSTKPLEKNTECSRKPTNYSSPSRRSTIVDSSTSPLTPVSDLKVSPPSTLKTLRAKVSEDWSKQQTNETARKLDFKENGKEIQPSYEFPDTLNLLANFFGKNGLSFPVSIAIPKKELCVSHLKMLRIGLGNLEQSIKEKSIDAISKALCCLQFSLSHVVLDCGMGMSFKKLFDEVHRSNLSKLCDNEGHAQETVVHYKKNRGTESFYKLVHSNKYLVLRKGDLKTLKSIYYSAADIKGVLSHVTRNPIVLGQYPTLDCGNQTAEFHRLYQCQILDSPKIPSKRICELRIALIDEETRELEQAIAEDDLVEVADALCDIQYVLSGAVHSFGMGSIFKTMFEEWCQAKNDEDNSINDD
eukprot:jgi/Bigna1/68720/fgenesh1_pg.7_\